MLLNSRGAVGNAASPPVGPGFHAAFLILNGRVSPWLAASFLDLSSVQADTRTTVAPTLDWPTEMEALD